MLLDKTQNEKEEALVNPILEEDDQLPEWLTPENLFNERKLRDYPLCQLHEELYYLDKWLQPTELDKYMRFHVYEETEKVILSVIDSATVYPFGSFLTNLYSLSVAFTHRCIPDSDLDLMVHCNEDINYLLLVEKALRESGIATNLTVLQHTRVPLVKFRHIVHVPSSRYS